MKTFGVGVDLVATQSIQKVHTKHAHRFEERILTPKERVLFKKSPQKLLFLAGRFCIKEAILKALGSGFREFGPIFQTLEVLPNAFGQPQLHILKTIARNHRCLSENKQWSLSISHHGDYVVAVAMWMEGPAKKMLG